MPINFAFLGLGILLFETFMDNGDLTFQMVEKINEFGEIVKEPLYQLRNGSEMVEVAKDQIYPSLAKFGYFPKWLSVVFLVDCCSFRIPLFSLTTDFFFFMTTEVFLLVDSD